MLAGIVALSMRLQALGQSDVFAAPVTFESFRPFKADGRPFVDHESIAAQLAICFSMSACITRMVVITTMIEKTPTSTPRRVSAERSL